MEKLKITSLYKYRSYNQFSLQSLINQTIWFSRPYAFNDPFDCNPKYESQFAPSSRKEFIRILQSKTGKEFDESYIDQYVNETKKYLNNIGVFCLSEVCDDILMWAHYANSHNGFVIEYERSPRNYLGKAAIPVYYTDFLPSITPIDLHERKEETLKKLWLYKSTHWEYEKEWRCYIAFGDTEQPMSVKIKSIIFGLKIRDDHVKTIKNILKNKKIKFKKAVKSSTKFKLDIIDC